MVRALNCEKTMLNSNFRGQKCLPMSTFSSVRNFPVR
uniref:Uncharacterized protein n=1 Tax=Rhizophora mucronata TaxID=61149 RepID=A0A2P2PD07_RHIMU